MTAPISPLIFSYKGLEPDAEFRDWVAAGLVGGVVIFKDNATSESQLRQAIGILRGLAPEKFRVMIDEEGGRVRRLPDSSASMGDLRTYQADEASMVASAYVRVADRLRGLGIDTLLAPVVDLGRPDVNWLRSRTFADGPDEVALMARTMIPAVQQRGIDCCAKHFPGSRGAGSDPHTGPVDDMTAPSLWEAADAVSFRAAIAAGVRMVMVGHQRLSGFDPMRPACLSPVIVNVLLRQRLGFSGLVLTDDLSMGAIVQKYPIEEAVTAALAAGCNMVLVCNDRALQRRALSSWQEWAARQSRTANV